MFQFTYYVWGPLSDYKQCLLDRWHDRNIKAAVMGMGYAGLPLAVEFARAGIIPLNRTFFRKSW